MFRIAVKSDLDRIMEIVPQIIADMRDYGSNQWDEKYPAADDFVTDISSKNLYVYDFEGDIGGFVCINNDEAEEYQGIKWSKDCAAVVIHRMSVNPLYWKRGIGTKLISFVEELAEKQNAGIIKTDTYSLNTKMKNLFVKCGFTYIGDVRFRGKKHVFNCFEKTLTC